MIYKRDREVRKGMVSDRHCNCYAYDYFTGAEGSHAIPVRFIVKVGCKRESVGNCSILSLANLFILD
jgi:hypothetical protein